MSDPKTNLLGLVQHYERTLRDMQEAVFFAQDPEGTLRRWYPPRPISDNGVLRGAKKGPKP